MLISAAVADRDQAAHAAGPDNAKRGETLYDNAGAIGARFEGVVGDETR